VLCYDPNGIFLPPPVNAFDTGSSAAAFAAPYFLGTGPVRVFRTTADGFLDFRQTFGFSGSDKSLKITMKVTNLSGLLVTGIVLRRQVDFDIDGLFGANNHATTGADSVSAWNDPGAVAESHGMVLRHTSQSSGVSHTASVTSGILDTACSPASPGTPVVGDYGDTVRYVIGTLKPGTSKTVKVDYHRK